MSGGCKCCCSYGNELQKKTQAHLLSKTILNKDDYENGTCDWFYDALDEALLAEDFEFVEKCLEYTDVKETSTDALLSLLIISKWAKNKIKNRSIFYQKCEEVFRNRHPKEWKGLLENLE